MNNKPYIATNRCILCLPELDESGLMRDFAIQNKEHLLPWQPIQTDSYYTENFWHERTKQIREDFQNDKSCCLNIYLKESQQLIGMVNYFNFIMMLLMQLIVIQITC